MGDLGFGELVVQGRFVVFRAQGFRFRVFRA